MGSLTEIGSSHTNMLAYTSSANTALKHIVGTPSMTSSASSGYGSQAVSCSNLTNDDTLSLRSISVDETPDFDRSSSASPPNKTSSKDQSAEKAKVEVVTNTTPYTPGSQQKRFNPFLKDIPNMEKNAEERLPISIQSVKKPLTPTKEHPLQDLSEENHKEDTSEEDGYCESKPNVVAQNDENKNVIIEAKEDDNRNTTYSSDEFKVNENGDDDVRTQTQPGKVVRRKKNSSTTAANPTQRASFPMGKSIINISIERLEAQMANLGNETDSSERLESHIDAPVPDWVVVGESVLIRPYNISGVISFIGSTHFQGGTWAGIELDTPTGKNDGTVQGIQYFVCKPKHGIFVRVDKLIQDKRGRAMRAYKAEKLAKESNLTRSKSRGESINTIGTARK